MCKLQGNYRFADVSDWQIERLFRLWKEHGKIDESRSKKPYRVLCEFYAKMCAMIIQQSLIQEGCWLDPLRSIVKAAASLRRECNRIMVAFYKGDLEETVQSILRTLRSGCRIERRATFPSTAQLLLDGLDWQLELLENADGLGEPLKGLLHLKPA